MPILYAPLSLFIWLLGTLGVAWPTETILRKLFPSEIACRFPPTWFSFSAGIGYALLSTLVGILAAAGAIWTPVLGLLIGVILLAGGWRLVSIIRGQAPNPLAGIGPCLWVAIIVALTMLPFIVLPPVAWDALTYHLEIPRQYLLHGSLIEMPRNIFAFFPLGMEMLYLLCLGVFPAFSCQMLHAGFLLLTILSIGETAKSAHLIPSRFKGLACLIVAAAAFLPSLWLNSITPYVDIALMYYFCLAVSGIYLYFASRCEIHLILGIVASAFLPAIKYTGYHCVLILIAGFLFCMLLRGGLPSIPYRIVITFSAAYGLFVGPHLLRNYLWTGNPVYPFLAGLVGKHPSGWNVEQNQVLSQFLAEYGTVLGHWLLYPFNYTVAIFAPTLGEDKWFDGALGPYLALWILVWIFRRQLSRENLFLVSVLCLYSVIWGMFLRQMRFLFPIIPLIVLFALGTFRYATHKQAWRAVLRIIPAVSLLFSLWVALPEITTAPVDSKANVRWSTAYLLGREAETEFLDHALLSYRCQNYINKHLPVSAKIWVLFTNNKNFYLRRAYISDYVIEDFTFHRWLLAASTPADLVKAFERKGVTHIFTRDAILDPALYMDKPDKRRLMIDFFARGCKLLHSSNGYAVFEIRAR